MRSVASFLVDDTGSVHLGGSARRAAVDDPDGVAVSAITERGQIEWLVRGGHVRVRLRPSMVSPAAYGRLKTWLACVQPERVLLSWFANGEWHYEFLRSPSLTAERITHLVGHHGGASGCNVRRRGCALTDFTEKRLDDVLGFWREHRNGFQREETMPVLGPLLDDRWVLYEELPSGVFKVADFGPYHTDHVRKWLTRQRHALLRPEEDNFTARGCAQVYRDIMHAFEPQSDALDAVAYWPGYGRLRSRYRRLMLPFRAGNRTWLASGICLDPGIDLLD